MSNKSTYCTPKTKWLLDVVVMVAHLSGMDTITDTTPSSKTMTTQTSRSEKRRAQAPGQLPPGFDPDAFTREACERSGVTFAVTDPVALSKLRVLTRPST